MAYQTKIRKVRVQVGAFSSDAMMQIGQPFAASITSRIRRGVNVQDQPAKPLKKGYAIAKRKHGGSGLRDWTWSGDTLDQLALLDVSANRGRIGFATTKADMIAHFNNAKERQFGVADSDRQVLTKTVQTVERAQRIARWVSA
jgi:hypothetical protein